MLERFSKELLDEVMEFAKLLRRVTIITIVTIALMLVPINLTHGDPIAFYLMKTALCSVIQRLFPVLGIDASNTSIVLIAGSPVGPVRVLLSSALFFGLLISSPISLYLFYRYLKPALYSHERRLAVRIVLYTALLFYSGVAYGFTVIAPLTMFILVHLGSTLGVAPYVTVADFYEFIALSVLATAVGFLAPLAIYFINKAFHISLNLRKHWRYILVIGYAVTAAITPDPTPITALLIIGPPLASSVLAEVVASKRRGSQ
jgi:sec-independent protein translocase protein TatC